MFVNINGKTEDHRIAVDTCQTPVFIWKLIKAWFALLLWTVWAPWAAAVPERDGK